MVGMHAAISLDKGARKAISPRQILTFKRTGTNYSVPGWGGHTFHIHCKLSLSTVYFLETIDVSYEVMAFHTTFMELAQNFGQVSWRNLRKTTGIRANSSHRQPFRIVRSRSSRGHIKSI